MVKKNSNSEIGVDMQSIPDVTANKCYTDPFLFQIQSIGDHYEVVGEKRKLEKALKSFDDLQSLWKNEKSRAKLSKNIY